VYAARASRELGATCRYRAPETYEGRVTPGSDLYAAGLVAWEMLTGRPACADSDVDHQIAWHSRHGAPDVRVVRPDCSPPLAALLLRLTAKSEADRPRDAVTLLAEIDAPDRAPKPSTWPPPEPAVAPPQAVPQSPLRPVSPPPRMTYRPGNATWEEQAPPREVLGAPAPPRAEPKYTPPAPVPGAPVSLPPVGSLALAVLAAVAAVVVAAWLVASL
jgi:serine/threonine-protein kinase